MKSIKVWILLSTLFLFSFVGCRDKQITSIPPETIPTFAKPNVKVYIENSGSMDGFFRGVTDFESIVYNYLANIKLHVTDSLSLNYINNQIILYDSLSDADVISDFIEKLDPEEFKKRGGDRGTTDISEIIKMVLNEKGKGISILVTDGIFSPGKDKNAEDYLKNQKIGIQLNIGEYLKRDTNTAVMIYQCQSNFNGTYFNNKDKKIDTTITLPFYIWVIGSVEDLAFLREKVKEESFEGEGVKKTALFVPGNQDIKYAIQSSRDYETKKTAEGKRKLTFTRKPNRDGENYHFSVNVDFSRLLLDSAKYVTDTAHYTLSMVSWKMKPIEEIDKQKSGYTHRLTFSSEKRQQGTLKIRLLRDVAVQSWDDINLENGSKPVKGKTYGIKYQINGVQSAYSSFNTSSSYCDIELEIE